MPGFEIFGDEERKEVQDVLNTGILMRYNFDEPRKGIWKAKELEQAIQDKFNTPYCELTSSGTTALMTAMSALGVGAGDEVIMPSFTFVASFEAILSMGAIPRIVDIDDTLCLSPEAVEAAINENTKLIMPVHMCGSMADMQPILDVAKKHKVLVLEDACQAIGGSYQGKRLGTLGDAGTFSFDFVKTVTSGEGGAVVTPHQAVYVNCDQYTDHGHDHIGNDRGAEDHPFVGLNFRISELHAAVGLAQFRKIDQIIEIQRRNKKIIKDILSEIPEIEFRRIPDEAGDNASFLSFFMPTEEMAEAVAHGMKKEGIPAVFYWYHNNWHYIKKWNHLKDLQTMAPLYDEHKKRMPNYHEIDFSASDYYMSRCITSLITLGWDEDACRERAEKMKAVIQSVMQGVVS